jgi:DNA-binding transcriptional MerR regulator
MNNKKKIERDKLIDITALSIKLGLINKDNLKPKTHTLRYWEKKFSQLKPLILQGGRRYYSFKQIEIAKLIFFLLKKQGLTIEGAQKVLNKKIINLDDFNSSSIKAQYFKIKIKNNSKKILDRIKKLKKLNG